VTDIRYLVMTSKDSFSTGVLSGSISFGMTQQRCDFFGVECAGLLVLVIALVNEHKERVKDIESLVD